MGRLSETPAHGILRRGGIRLLALALMSFPAVARGEEPRPWLAAWVELVGPGGAPSIRVVMPEKTPCPALRADGEDVKMDVRADEKPLFPGDEKPRELPPASFPVIVCEATLKPGTAAASLGDKYRLALPPAVIKRIVVLGDTGCRVKGKKTQTCGDPKAWPYKRLADLAAAAGPDLVIHVGDYLYREKCKGASCTKTGYGWDIWNADFFLPSQRLLAKAPWIMARGNHEACDRAGEGWARFLDGPKPGSHCPQVSDSILVDLGDIGFAVVDSSSLAEADESNPADPDIKQLRDKYDAIARRIPGNAWLVTHAPFNGLRATKTGSKFDNTVLNDALAKRLVPGIKMIVSGHIHLFEGLNFSDGRLPQLVVGSSGTNLATAPSSTKGIPLHRKRSVILQSFGFMLWERDDAEGTAWNGKLVGTDGQTLVSCRMEGKGLDCRKGS